MAAHSLFQNKLPSLSGRERCFAATKPWINGAAWAPDQVRDMPRLAGAKHPWPGTRLNLFAGLMAIPRTRPNTPAEVLGPCRKRSRGYVSAPCRRWNVGGFNPSPTAEGRKPSMAFLLATGHEPLAIPSPRTTNQVPRTNRADTRIRPYEEITLTTRYMPQATGHELSFSSRFWTPVFAWVSSRYLQRQGS